jgi:crossover junction endodeoxyribonuclease RuvC
MSNINIIALDLSLTSSGVSFGSQLNLITTNKRGAERLFHISSEIMKLVVAQNITHAVIEGYSFASRNSQAHSIGELGGCVRMRLWENGIPYVEVPPTSRAKFATGKGNASKGEVISAISAKTGIVFAGSGGNDMCDAWVLMEMAQARLGLSEWSWSKTQLEALDKVDWSPLESGTTTTNGE